MSDSEKSLKPCPEVVFLTKECLRETMRARRDAMSGAEAGRLSALARARLLALPSVARADVICVYASHRNEVQTLPLVELWLNENKEVCLPRVAGKLLELRRIGCIEDLVAGKFGILEPRATLPLIEASRVACFVVPGLAFDLCGNRLGRGAGFYDRLLAGLSGKKIGLGYRFQIVGEPLPTDDWDVPLDGVVTD